MCPMLQLFSILMYQEDIDGRDRRALAFQTTSRAVVAALWYFSAA